MQITGCSSGIGDALAKVLHATKTITVIATARRLSALASLESLGIHCIALDVTDDTSVSNAITSILSSHKRIDILINNAGLSRVGPAIEQPLDEVREVLETNVLGVYRVTQAVVQHAMAAQNSGLIINIGSVVSYMATPWASAYSASKAALLAMTDSLRMEVAPLGVSVTYTMAGAIRSSFGDNTFDHSTFHRYEKKESLYSTWVQSIQQRSRASQAPGSMSAEVAALQIAHVVDAWRKKTSLNGDNRSTSNALNAVPTWFFVGGNAMYYWLIGLIQKLLGWPVNNMFMKKFGLLE